MPVRALTCSSTAATRSPVLFAITATASTVMSLWRGEYPVSGNRLAGMPSTTRHFSTPNATV